MHRSLTPIACLIAGVAILVFSTSASALPVHRHIWAFHRPDPTAGTGPRKVLIDRFVVNVAPPYQPPVTVVQTEPYTPPYQAPVLTSSGGCTVSLPHEASSPTSVNPSSGAYGCYQITPGTAANYGCDLSTQAGQDSCAGAICAKQGPSAWTNPAGENPCGRLGG